MAETRLEADLYGPGPIPGRIYKGMTMLVEGPNPQKYYTVLQNLHAAALEYRERFGALPDTVDGQDLVGECSRCQALIFDGDPYEDGDAVRCMRCVRVEHAETEDQAPGVNESASVIVESKTCTMELF